MRIIHLTAPASGGGLERVVEMLSRGLLDRGHEVTVLAVIDSPADSHAFLKVLRDTGVPVEAVSLGSRDYLGERRAVRKALSRVRPDVAHSHGYRSDVIDSPIARSSGVPVVSTLHGFTGGGFRNNFYEWLQVRANRRMDRCVAVSRPIVERLVAGGVEAGKIQLVKNSFRSSNEILQRADACAMLGLNAQMFNVGWIGRMSSEKGPDIMYEAAILLAKRGMITTFVGEGPEQPTLMARAQADGVKATVKFAGAVPGAGRLIRAFDVLAISSRTEGTPIVLFEAIAAGVPVVSTRVGGIPDVLSDQEGILVDPVNPGELSDGILRIASNPAGGRQLAERALERMHRELDFDRWLDAYEEIYGLAIQARRSRT